MICLRCGYCCLYLDVIIIKPEKISRGGDVDFEDESSYMHKPSLERCPHLIWEKGLAVCKIHHLPWFQKTPCADFSQIEEDVNDPCRLGTYWKGREFPHFRRSNEY